MKQMVIIIGKDSSGKTTLAENSVHTDCDVGAPNLHRHMPLKPEVRETHEFIRRRLPQGFLACSPSNLRAERRIQ